MLGCELLVTLAQRERLRGLNETAGTVRVFLEIHVNSLSLFLRPGGAQGTSSMGMRLLPPAEAGGRRSNR
jgi:hypothetical protein